MPTDILYVITDLRLGGVPLHLFRLATAMRDRGFRISVVCLRGPDAVAAMLREAGIPVFDCRGRGAWDIRVIARLARHIRRFRPKIVHAMLFHANLAVRLAAALLRFPASRVLCEIQTVEVQQRWHLLVESLTCPLTRLTIGNSPSVVEHLARTARVPRHRLRLIRGGVDTAKVQAAPPADRRACGLPDASQAVFWAGRLDKIKGLHYLLGAFAQVVRRRPARLLLAGEGPQHARLKRRADDLGLHGWVRFLGPRRDVPSLLKAADVFAFPSLTEGLPNALLEAMAAGCPIVAADVSGCRDLIAHEQTGLLVPPRDTLALAEGILRLLEDRALAKRLGRAAQEEVAKCWHAERMLAEYAALYRQVLCDAQTAPGPQARSEV